MSQAHRRDEPSASTKRTTEWPWEKPDNQTPREQVVRILAEGIWEMVLAGKTPRPGTSTRSSGLAKDT